MSRKLTIAVSEEMYDGLHRSVGRRHISAFLEKPIKPHVLSKDLDSAYQEMALDEEREQEAQAWSEGLIADVAAEHPDTSTRRWMPPK
jgi:hypothetical protein